MTISFDATDAIVAGTDMSDRAQNAVEWAADRADDLGRKLMIVLALPEVPIPPRSRLFDAMRTGDYPNTCASSPMSAWACCGTASTPSTPISRSRS